MERANLQAMRCRGMRDFLPEDMAKFRHIEGVFRERCALWGYEEVRPPTLEYLYSFTSTGRLPPERLSTLFSFLDLDGWSGERVVLRPDGTIPLVRLYLDNYPLGEEKRFFYIVNTFHFEPTGQDSRERWQVGVEYIGSPFPQGDGEVLSLAVEVLQTLGLSAQVHLSHSTFVQGLLEALGLGPEGLRELKQGSEGLFRALERKNRNLGQALQPFFSPQGAGGVLLKNLRAPLLSSFPSLEPALNQWLQVCDLLDNLGVSYMLYPLPRRDFEYYTGAIFDLFVSGMRVGGGGRYDNLVGGEKGKGIPAVGFALYLDNLLSLVSPSPFRERVVVRAVKGKPAEWGAARELAQRLRDKGCPVQEGGSTSKGPEVTVSMAKGAPVYQLYLPGRGEWWGESLEELVKRLSSR